MVPRPLHSPTAPIEDMCGDHPCPFTTSPYPYNSYEKIAKIVEESITILDLCEEFIRLVVLLQFTTRYPTGGHSILRESPAWSIPVYDFPEPPNDDRGQLDWLFWWMRLIYQRVTRLMGSGDLVFAWCIQRILQAQPEVSDLLEMCARQEA